MANPNFLFIVVLLQVRLNLLGHLQFIDPFVVDAIRNLCSTQVLKVEREGTMDWDSQHGLEEHATDRVLVVLDQTADRRRGEDVRIMRIETKLMIQLLDASVKSTSISPKAHTKKELFLSTIPQEESPFRLLVQLLFGLVPVHLSPVETAVGDLEKVGYQMVYVVDLRVGSGEEVEAAGASVESSGLVFEVVPYVAVLD